MYYTRPSKSALNWAGIENVVLHSCCSLSTISFCTLLHMQLLFLWEEGEVRWTSAKNLERENRTHGETISLSHISIFEVNVYCVRVEIMLNFYILHKMARTPVGRNPRDYIMNIQIAILFFNSEHQELLKQMQDTQDFQAHEDLEQELDCLVKQMEMKRKQISKLKKHQATVRMKYKLSGY